MTATEDATFAEPAPAPRRAGRWRALLVAFLVLVLLLAIGWATRDHWTPSALQTQAAQSDALAARVAQLDQRLNALGERTTPSATPDLATRERIDALEQRLTALAARLAAAEQQLGEATVAPSLPVADAIDPARSVALIRQAQDRFMLENDVAGAQRVLATLLARLQVDQAASELRVAVNQASTLLTAWQVADAGFGRARLQALKRQVDQWPLTGALTEAPSVEPDGRGDWREIWAAYTSRLVRIEKIANAAAPLAGGPAAQRAAVQRLLDEALASLHRGDLADRDAALERVSAALNAHFDVAHSDVAGALSVIEALRRVPSTMPDFAALEREALAWQARSGP